MLGVPKTNIFYTKSTERSCQGKVKTKVKTSVSILCLEGPLTFGQTKPCFNPIMVGLLATPIIVGGGGG